jgi:phage terminase small subunit
MKKLTPKQEKFANLYVEYSDKTQAYLEAYDVSETTQNESVRVLAYREANKANVRLRVTEIQNELGELFKIKQGYVITKLLDVINSAEETFELAKLLDADKEEKSRFFRMMNQTKNSDILSALNQLAKMLGLNEPEKIEQTVRTIEIIEKKRE